MNALVRAKNWFSPKSASVQARTRLVQPRKKNLPRAKRTERNLRTQPPSKTGTKTRRGPRASKCVDPGAEKRRARRAKTTERTTVHADSGKAGRAGKKPVIVHQEPPKELQMMNYETYRKAFKHANIEITGWSKLSREHQIKIIETLRAGGYNFAEFFKLVDINIKGVLREMDG